MIVKCGKEEDFSNFKAINMLDSYSRRVMEYVFRWADLMEREIDQGRSIAEIADETSSVADEDGITGFQYGCAVNILAQYWIYGEELNKWHNAKYGYKGEGTVNPAVMVLEPKKGAL